MLLNLKKYCKFYLTCLLRIISTRIIESFLYYARLQLCKNDIDYCYLFLSILLLWWIIFVVMKVSEENLLSLECRKNIPLYWEGGYSLLTSRLVSHKLVLSKSILYIIFFVDMKRRGYYSN